MADDMRTPNRGFDASDHPYWFAVSRGDMNDKAHELGGSQSDHHHSQHYGK
jgi:hypothetical protein